ncbi:MAG: hypothetical protein CYPHOPRED_002441 [Cyphobasidiales sp. Tagirdzhanova-0007]|nr:MAG: hypothetical protein CYPHOPRED_002441 [Cyphobasidiales sp. Tagirdzhanova-0007]
MGKRKLDSLAADTEKPDKRKKVTAKDFKPVEPGVLSEGAHLDLADSDIYYVADFVDKSTARRWYKELMELDTYRVPTYLENVRTKFSAISTAYGSGNSADSIKYSGTEVPLQKQHPAILQEIQAFLEDRLKTNFNHCMLNRYDTGAVYIGSHSDNLGAARDFVLSHKKKPHDVEGEKYKKRWALADGSLVLMQGSTQKYWKHEIPKQLKTKGGHK